MGTLGGHLIPGTFFAIYAIWWSFITAIRHVQAKNRAVSKNDKRNYFKSTVTMPCIFLPCAVLRNAPIESYSKAILAFIALVIEGYTGYKIEYKRMEDIMTEHIMMPDHTTMSEMSGMSHNHKRSADGHLVRVWHFEKGNAQHITMYSAFIMGAIIEILIHYGVELPKRLEYAMGVVAFTIEAFLFAFHLHGKEVIDVYVHVLLVYAIVGCIIFSILEGYNQRQVLFTYGRIVFTLLQGTWFYQVGFMLYPPTDSPSWKWNLSDHGSIMTVTVCFCWHVLLIIIGLLFQYLLIKKCLSKSSYMRLKMNIDDLNENETNINSNGKNEMRFLTLESDSDDNCLEESINNNKNRFLNSKFAISEDNHL